MSESPASEAQKELREQIVDNQKVIDRLNADLARKTQEVRIIQEVSREITSTLKLHDILEIILQSLDATLGFRHTMILLTDEAGESLRVMASRGYDVAGVGATVPVGVGTIGVVAKRRKMMRVGNLQAGRAYGAAVRTGLTEQGTTTSLTEVVPLPGLKGGQSQIAIPLMSKDQLVGVFAVESPQPAAFDELDEVLVTILAHQAAAAIHNAQMYEAEQRRVEEIRAATEKLAALNENLEGAVAARTGELAAANANMAAALEQVQREQRRSKELLGRMAPPEVIPLMLEDTLLARKLNATILFTDLEGFTKFSSGMEPDELFAKLNHFFNRAGKSVEKYRGYVNKTNGDAIMALFGVPYEHPTHALDAVLAGLDMQREIQAHFSLRMRIGVNSGAITAGILGPSDKSLYDVLGDPVNVASRMEKACPPGSIAISDGTRDLIEPYFEIKSLGKQQVKGKGAMPIYEVVGVRKVAEDPRRVDPGSLYAKSFAGAQKEIDDHKARLAQVDFRSLQARDGAINHNEAVADFALALLRHLRKSGSGLVEAVKGIEEATLVDLALLHDLGKHAVAHDRLNQLHPSIEEIEKLRSDLLRETIGAVKALGLDRLVAAVEDLYAFERAKSEVKKMDPLAALVAAPDIHDALVAPKIYKGRGWTIAGSLEEIVRMPKDPVTVDIFRAFVELMRPESMRVSDSKSSAVLFR